MARTDCNFSFFMSYEMKFKVAIRGHYVYKVTCTPILDEVLICKKDNREEAKEYHLHAVGVYKESPDEENLDLIGHVPIELSRVLVGCCFWLLQKRTLSLSKFVENENLKWVLSCLDVTELGQTERKLLTY